MAGACGRESCCQLPGKGLRKGLSRLRAGKQQARTPLKTDGWGVARESLLPVALERPAGGFEAFEGGQTAGSNALKNRWLGACGCESCCQLPWKGLRKGLKRLREGKRQARTPLKTDGWGMWLRELLPVALERLAEGFEAFEGGQTAGSNALKNRWLGRGCESRCCQLPWKGLREGLSRLRAGKRQARTPLKTDGWGVAARVVASCL